MEKLKLKISHSGEFTNFLKKFSGVDSSLLLELENEKLKAKTHTPERSVVKFSSIDLDKIFSSYKIDKQIKIGIQNIDKLAQSFKYFGESEFELIIEIEELNGENIGTKLTMKNSSLNISFPCASLNMFTYITDDILDKITNTDNSIVDFTLVKEQQSKIYSLFGIDTDHPKLTISVENEIIKAKGKNFKYDVIKDDNIKTTAEISILKHHFVHLDKEDTQIFVTDDKLILKSNETDTKLIIGEAE